MAVTLYTQDAKRPISIYPQMDCTDAVIQARLYNLKDNTFIGFANSRKPFDEDLFLGRVTLNIDLHKSIEVNLSVMAKMRTESVFSEIKSETQVVSTGDYSATDYEITMDFNPNEYEDFAFSYTFTTGVEGDHYDLNKVYLETYPISNLDGLIVGGGTGEEIVVPLDGRTFEPGTYSIVFVAEGVGVIARDIAILYSKNAYMIE